MHFNEILILVFHLHTVKLTLKRITQDFGKFQFFWSFMQFKLNLPIIHAFYLDISALYHHFSCVFVHILTEFGLNRICLQLMPFI